jgi:hypothetical protein
MKKYLIVLSSIVGAVVLLLPTSIAFAATISVGSLSPGTTVKPGNEVYFSLSPSGFVGTPTYTVSDSLSGSSVVSSDVNADGNFVWIPTTSDAGTHTINITATDNAGDSAATSQMITVNGTPAVTIGSLSPSNVVTVGTPVFFSASATSFTSTPTYSVSDSLNTSTVSNADINSAGGFSWTPSAADIGTHTITVTATDTTGDTATASQSVTVNTGTSVSITALSPGSSVASGQTVTFTAVPTGFTSPTLSMNDSYNGNSSVTLPDFNTATGVFTWTPVATDIGTHTITVSGTDSLGHNASASVTLIVNTNIIPTTTTTTTIVTPVSSGTTDTATLEAELASLTSQLNALEAEEKSLTGSTGVAAVASTTFTRPLSLGDVGTDVQALQVYLNSHGFPVATSGLGSAGQETTKFGALTEQALIQFQASVGLPSTGYFGPLTTAYVTSH